MRCRFPDAGIKYFKDLPWSAYLAFLRLAPIFTYDICLNFWRVRRM